METESIDKDEQEVEFFDRDCVDLWTEVNDVRMNQQFNLTLLRT